MIPMRNGALRPQSPGFCSTGRPTARARPDVRNGCRPRIPLKLGACGFDSCLPGVVLTHTRLHSPRERERKAWTCVVLVLIFALQLILVVAGRSGPCRRPLSGGYMLRWLKVAPQECSKRTGRRLPPPTETATTVRLENLGAGRFLVCLFLWEVTRRHARPRGGVGAGSRSARCRVTQGLLPTSFGAGGWIYW